MLEFHVALQNSLGTDFPIPSDLILVPQRYSATAMGGFDHAEIEVQGSTEALYSILRWLSLRIYIYNRNGSVVWAGYVDEASVSVGSVQMGVSLKNMANKVDVFYSTTVNGVSIDGRTGFATDTDSVTRYGTKEKLLTSSNTNLTKATNKRDSKLTSVKYPPGTLSLSLGNAGQSTGKLTCRGFIHTLDWRYYEQLSGLEENGETGNATQVLGQGFTATTIGFTNDGKIHDQTGRFNKFYEGNVAISGSTSNDGSRLISGVDSRDAQSYTATSISLDTSDDIHDFPNDGLGFFQPNDFMQMSGTVGGHDGTYRVKSAAADHLTVNPGSIGVQAAGPSITVARGNWIQTTTGGIHETVGDTVTITAHGQKIAQSFTLTNNVSAWTVDKIVIRVQKIGSPSDNVRVELCANSSGSPGSVIEGVNVAASAIATVMEWTEFAFSNANSLTYGTTYWIVISRTGSNEAANHYLIDVDESLPYSGGAMKLYTGAAWVARSTDADLVFRILGAWTTTAQMQQMITDVGTFFSSTDIIDASGVSSNQYRNGETTAYEEFIALLEDGTSNDLRMLADVTPGRVLRIYEQPATTEEPTILIDTSGNLTTYGGSLLEHGKLPHGQLIGLAGIPPTIDTLTKVSPFLCERAEFDCIDNRYTAIEPQGTDDPWNMGSLTEG